MVKKSLFYYSDTTSNEEMLMSCLYWETVQTESGVCTEVVCAKVHQVPLIKIETKYVGEGGKRIFVIFLVGI